MPHNETLLTLRSKDATSGLKNDFTIELQNPLHNVTGLRLVGSGIPNTIHNVKATDGFTVDIPSGGFTLSSALTFTPGFYTILTLCSAMETLLNSAGAGFTVAYDDTTALVTIARSVDTFELRFSGNTGTLLGFSADIPILSTTATGDMVVDMTPNGLFHHISIDFGTADFSCIVPRGGILSTSVLSEKELISQCREYQRFNITRATIKLYHDPETVAPRTLADIQSNWEIVVAVRTN